MSMVCLASSLSFVLAFDVLVAFDDFLIRHLGEGVTMVDTLHVPYGRA